MDETSNFSVTLKAQRQSNRYTTPDKNISASRNNYDLHDAIYETRKLGYLQIYRQMMASTSYSRIVFSYPREWIYIGYLSALFRRQFTEFYAR